MVVVALVVRFGSAATFSLVLALPAAGRVTAPFVQSTKAEQTAIPFGASTVAADLYRPAHPRGAILLVHGLSPAGRRQPDPARLAELLARVAPRFYFNPNVEYVFVDNGTYMTFNGDFHYDFPTHGRTYTWLGAGPALVRVDPEGPANANTDLAANLLGGIGFRRGSVIPYIQAKAIIKSDSLVSLAVGLRF